MGYKGGCGTSTRMSPIKMEHVKDKDGEILPREAHRVRLQGAHAERKGSKLPSA